MHLRKSDEEKEGLEQHYKTSSDDVSAADRTVLVHEDTVDWSKYMAAEHARVSDIVAKAVDENSRKLRMKITLVVKERSLPSREKKALLPSVRARDRGTDKSRSRERDWSRGKRESGLGICGVRVLMDTGEKEKKKGYAQANAQAQRRGWGQGQGVKSKSTDDYEAGLALWEDKFNRFKDSSHRLSTSTVSTVSAIAISKITGHRQSKNLEEVCGG